MNTHTGISPRALLAAVLAALAVGVLASLSIRPPGTAAAPTGGSGTERQEIRWRLTSAFNTHLPAIGEAVVYVSDALARASAGTIVLQPFEPGELVPPFSITEAVRERKVQAGITWLGYDQGRMPASTLIASVPFGMEPWEFMAWWYEGGGRELGEALYHEQNVHPVLCSMTGPETAGWFREPIASVDDFVGMKIRFAGLGGEVLQRLGASVTLIPGGEIFQALEKGAIDATEFSLPVIDQMLGFDQVAKFNYFPGWHQPFSAGHLVVNLDLWSGLGGDTRAMIDLACTASVSRALARSEAAQGAVIRGFEQKGVTAASLPRSILEELRRVSHQVLDEQAAADRQFARILASQRAFSETYGNWKRLGYLPRDF